MYADRFERQRLPLEINLPAGVQLKADTTGPVVWKGAFGRYERRVSREEGVIRVEKQMELAPQIVSKDQYSAFIRFCRLVDQSDSFEFTISP